MQSVEFAEEFRHRSGPASIKVYHAGWSGAVDDEVCDAASEAGALKSIEGQEVAQPEPLADMTVSELREMAAKMGVELGDRKKKADIVAVIQEALDAAPDAETS